MVVIGHHSVEHLASAAGVSQSKPALWVPMKHGNTSDIIRETAYPSAECLVSMVTSVSMVLKLSCKWNIYCSMQKLPGLLICHTLHAGRMVVRSKLCEAAGVARRVA